MSTGEKQDSQRKAATNQNATGVYDTGPKGGGIVNPSKIDRPSKINRRDIPVFNTQRLPLDNARDRASITGSQGGEAIGGNYLWFYNESSVQADASFVFNERNRGDLIPISEGLQIIAGSGFDLLFFDNDAQAGEHFDFAYMYVPEFVGSGVQVLSQGSTIRDVNVTSAGTGLDSSVSVAASNTETLVAANGTNRIAQIQNHPDNTNRLILSHSGATLPGNGIVLEPGETETFGDLGSGFTFGIDGHNPDNTSDGTAVDVRIFGARD